MPRRTSPYLAENGLVRRCCSCGAFRNHEEPGRWDRLERLPEGLRAPVSHGLCEACFLRDHGEPIEVAVAPAVARAG